MTSFRHSDSSFRRSDSSFRHSNSSFHHSDSSFRRSDPSFRHSVTPNLLSIAQNPSLRRYNSPPSHKTKKAKTPFIKGSSRFVFFMQLYKRLVLFRLFPHRFDCSNINKQSFRQYEHGRLFWPSIEYQHHNQAQIP